MQFLADESCDFAVVRALRSAGFDVMAVSEIAPRLTDQAVVAAAVRERRVLLTEDKDFGHLVYASRGSDQHITGRFAVIQPGRVRTRRLPRD